MNAKLGKRQDGIDHRGLLADEQVTGTMQPCVAQMAASVEAGPVIGSGSGILTGAPFVTMISSAAARPATGNAISDTPATSSSFTFIGGLPTTLAKQFK
jgi:hypothetical protein